MYIDIVILTTLRMAAGQRGVFEYVHEYEGEQSKTLLLCFLGKDSGAKRRLFALRKLPFSVTEHVKVAK